jgi:hypothetical protein
MSENAQSPEKKWAKLVEQFSEEKLEFFLDTELIPTVKIPGDNFQQDWAVDSLRFNDFIVTRAFELYGAIPKSSEMDFLLSLFREECRVGGRRVSQEQEATIDKDVIVQGVVCVMNEKSEFNDKTAVLLTDLITKQAEGKFSKQETLPPFTNIFSRKLNRLIPVLL